MTAIRCPVCHQKVAVTRSGRIAVHVITEPQSVVNGRQILDEDLAEALHIAGHNCAGSGRPAGGTE